MTGVPRFGPILVPLDGSEAAEQALPVGARLARAAGETLHLATVEEPLSALFESTEYPAVAQQIRDDTRRHLVEYLADARTVAERAGAPVVETALLGGDVAAGLSEHLTDRRVGLVVMTTHGRTGLSRFWLGSVAERLLQSSPVPTLLLRPGDEPQTWAFRRLLVALDGEIEQEVMDAALALSGLLPAPPALALVRIVEPAVPVLTRLAVRPAHFGSDWTERRQVEARTYLARLADRLRTRGLEVTDQVLVGRPVHQQILRYAGAIVADLIVLGTHGARGLERLALGSVADKVIRQGELPVLVAPVRRRVGGQGP